MNRRVTFTYLDNAHDVGPLGTDKGQLFVKNGKLFAQLPPNDAVELADLGLEVSGPPVGTIINFGGSATPAGWLACDGTSYSRTTYADLFAAISTAYGAPTGTTFLVPDLRGRNVLGVGTGTGLSARLLAATGGYEAVTLVDGDIPSHSHTVNDGGHSHGTSESSHSHGTSDSGHSHGTSESSHSHTISSTSHSHGGIPNTISTSSTSITEGDGYGSTYVLTDASMGYSNGSTSSASSGGSLSDSTTGLSVSSATTGLSVSDGTTGLTVNSGSSGISLGNHGGSGAHSNMTPFLALTYLIKA